jgi:hypothetical protein
MSGGSRSLPRELIPCRGLILQHLGEREACRLMACGRAFVPGCKLRVNAIKLVSRLSLINLLLFSFLTVLTLLQAAWAAMANRMASESLLGVDGAAMLSANGVLWGKSDKLVVRQDELKALANAFNDPSAAANSGIYFAGRRYITIRATATEVLGRSGANGVYAMKATRSIVVGTCPSFSIPGTCAQQVARYAELSELLQHNGL